MPSTPPVTAQPNADDIRAVLMPVSLLLLAAGLCDGGMILYSAWVGRAYTSNAYVFALAGAIFLAKGSLFTIRIAMVAVPLFLSAILGAAVGGVLQLPAALVSTWLSHAPGEVALSALRTGGLCLLLGWILKKLIHPVIMQALIVDGMPLANYWKRPVTGFMLGLLVPLATGMSFAAMQASDLGKQAVDEAAKQARPAEAFYLLNVQPAPSSDSRSRVEALVAAYSPSGLRKLHVTWHAPTPFGAPGGTASDQAASGSETPAKAP
jgi:hypothetical protein